MIQMDASLHPWFGRSKTTSIPQAKGRIEPTVSNTTVTPADKITLFLAVLTPRKIDAGHCIRFRNKYYALADEQGCRADFYKGTAAIVIRTLSGKLYVYAMAGKEAP